MSRNEHDGTDHDDARLVALLDGELDDEARAALEARFNAEPDLRARLRQFRDSERPFARAFQLLLDAAPVDRLSASLAGLDKGPGWSPQASPPSCCSRLEWASAGWRQSPPRPPRKPPSKARRTRTGDKPS